MIWRDGTYESGLIAMLPAGLGVGHGWCGSSEAELWVEDDKEEARRLFFFLKRVRNKEKQ